MNTNEYNKLVDAIINSGFTKTEDQEESYSKIVKYNDGTFKCIIKLSEVSVDKFIVLIEDVDVTSIPVADLMNSKFEIIKSVKNQIHEYCNS